MNDERIEQRLRDWLAVEADAMDVPARVRSAADAARASALARPARRRWFAWRRSATLAAGVAVIVVATVVSITLTGVLPLGRPDCSGVTIEALRAKVKDVPGYTWHMTGSELVHGPLNFASGRPDLEFWPAPVELSGVYNAPDSWRVEVVQGYDPEPIVPPSVGGYINEQFDGYLLMDGAAFVRARGGTHYESAGEWSGSALFQREANQLYGVLFGLEFRTALPDLPLTEANLDWRTETTSNGCVLRAQPLDFSLPSGAIWERTVTVNPHLLLPVAAEVRLTLPRTVPSDPQGIPSETDYHVLFKYDYANVPQLQAPVIGAPVSEERARADAQGVGSGEVITGADYQLGTAQAFVEHGRDGLAVLLYEDGELTSSQLVPSDVDVWVGLVRSHQDPPAVFLVSFLNDSRVTSVRVQFSNGEMREISGNGETPQAVTTGEGLGEIVTWTAYDEGGNEVATEPPAP